MSQVSEVSKVSNQVSIPAESGTGISITTLSDTDTGPDQSRADPIKGNDPDLLHKLQTATGWSRARVRRFLMKCDEARASERDEIIRAREARS